MRIALIPLDERPVNVRYPRMLAGIAGIDLLIPPPEALSRRREPADWNTLRTWLLESAGAVDALIVSCEMLGYGGLIASRISSDPAGAVMDRLEVLREIRKRHPRLIIYGFNIITRISNANDNFEEPGYWEEYGTRIYQYSKLADQSETDSSVIPARDRLRSGIPRGMLDDFLSRRLRNHGVNLSILQMVSGGVFDFLVLSSDDTSPHGFGSREKRWLREWVDRLGIGGRVLMYPGADEVGCVLLMRCFNESRQRQPLFFPRYLTPEGARVVAAYEDVPIQTTFERQVNALGGQISSEAPDFFCAINTPVSGQWGWSEECRQTDARERMQPMEYLAAEVQQHLEMGGKVAVADVAYPNGAEPNFFDLLRQKTDLGKISAYAAWNTAGNSIGTLLAHAAATAFIQTPEQQDAHARFLLHRLLEDWGYQLIVRREVREHLMRTTGSIVPAVSALPEVCGLIEKRLQELLDTLPGFSRKYHITPCSVWLPWGRTFEVDFELTGGSSQKMAPDAP